MPIHPLYLWLRRAYTRGRLSVNELGRRQAGPVGPWPWSCRSLSSVPTSRMTRSDPHRGAALTVLFWAAILSVPMIAMVIGIGYLTYWTIAPFRVLAEGDPLFAFDAEIGYVARPNSSTRWAI